MAGICECCQRKPTDISSNLIGSINMKQFVIGDIHGRYKALVSVLKQSKFDYENDLLIVLGDVVDGGNYTYKVIEELLKIKNLILCIGNHDDWALQWMKTGFELPLWVNQGGIHTIRSYYYRNNGEKCTERVPQSHIDFLESAVPFYRDEKGRIYVHGGFDPTIPIEENDLDTLMWDRDLIEYAIGGGIIKYPHVFIGHTTTQLVKGTTKPLTINNLTLMDTGGGWNGILTIMDVNTGDYWQSGKQKPKRE